MVDVRCSVSIRRAHLGVGVGLAFCWEVMDHAQVKPFNLQFTECIHTSPFAHTHTHTHTHAQILMNVPLVTVVVLTFALILLAPSSVVVQVASNWMVSHAAVSHVHAIDFVACHVNLENVSVTIVTDVYT